MSAFTFEIVRQDEAPISAHVVMLPNGGAVWRHVEALALRIQNRDGTFIRVKNSEGKSVLRAGIITVLASIEKCPCLGCPIKRELEQRASTGHRTAADFGLQIQCGLRGREMDSSAWPTPTMPHGGSRGQVPRTQIIS